MNEQLSRIESKLASMQKESMDLKLDIKDTVHKIDKRLSLIEHRWKIITPLITLFFVSSWEFIKTKLGVTK